MEREALAAAGRRVVTVGLLAAVLLAASAAPAAAGDEEAKSITARVQEYVRQLTKLRKSEDVYHVHEVVWKAPDLFKEVGEDPSGAALQARLVKGIGQLSRHRDERVRLSAIEALGVMGHADGAAYLKPYLKNIKEKPAKPLTLAAIDAAGGMADESLAAPLLKFVAQSPAPQSIRHAVEALGQFGKVKSKREEILLALLDTTLDEEDFERWKVLAKGVPGALNRLTGRDVESLDDWLKLIDTHRADPSVLFPPDEEAEEEEAGS